MCYIGPCCFGCRHYRRRVCFCFTSAACCVLYVCCCVCVPSRSRVFCCVVVVVVGVVSAARFPVMACITSCVFFSVVWHRRLCCAFFCVPKTPVGQFQFFRLLYCDLSAYIRRRVSWRDYFTATLGSKSNTHTHRSIIDETKLVFVPKFEGHKIYSLNSAVYMRSLGSVVYTKAYIYLII